MGKQDGFERFFLERFRQVFDPKLKPVLPGRIKFSQTGPVQLESSDILTERRQHDQGLADSERQRQPVDQFRRPVCDRNISRVDIVEF